MLDITTEVCRALMDMKFVWRFQTGHTMLARPMDQDPVIAVIGSEEERKKQLLNIRIRFYGDDPRVTFVDVERVFGPVMLFLDVAAGLIARLEL
jgi:hypothetical protein